MPPSDLCTDCRIPFGSPGFVAARATAKRSRQLRVMAAPDDAGAASLCAGCRAPVCALCADPIDQHRRARFARVRTCSSLCQAVLDDARKEARFDTRQFAGCLSCARPLADYEAAEGVYCMSPDCAEDRRAARAARSTARRRANLDRIAAERASGLAGRACRCGCAAMLTDRGVGRPKSYATAACRQRASRSRRASPL